MNAYQIKTIIPSLSSITYLSQFKNRDLIEANKFISSSDDYGLSIYLENFLGDELNTNIDKAFGLINLRMVNLGNEIKIKVDSDDNIPTTIKMDLRKILIKILSDPQRPIEEFEKEDIKITFTLPEKIYYKNMISFLLDIVKSIAINGNDIKYESLSLTERKKLLLKIRPELINDIKNHIKTKQKRYDVIGVNHSKINNHISFYDNSFFYFIKFIYKFNLSSIYNKLYLTCKNLNISFSDFCNLTPAETDMLIAIYKKNNSIK